MLTYDEREKAVAGLRCRPGRRVLIRVAAGLGVGVRRMKKITFGYKFALKKMLDDPENLGRKTAYHLTIIENQH